MQITSVNLAKSYLEFSDTSAKCYQLNLVTKAVSFTKCAEILEFSLPELAPPLDPFQLLSVRQLKDGKLVAIVIDPESRQQLVTNTSDGWQIMLIPECANNCTYQFL